MAYTLFLTLDLRKSPPSNPTKTNALPPISEPTDSSINSPINDPFKESKDELPKPVRIELAH